MSLSTQPYKGARDFYPEDMRLQKYIFSKWRQVCESFGYEEYTAPILENAEIYEAKSGQEIVNEEMYVFTDRGERRVAIRPEMTPTVSRMVAARRQELAFPLRWYSIPNLWRYDRPQRGRLREHWQLNVDLFGDESVNAEFEIVNIADQIMQSFGAKRSMYEIRLNSRKFIDYLLKDYFKLDPAEALTVIKLIDKKSKIEPAEFRGLMEAAISPTQREAENTAQRIIELMNIESAEQLPTELINHPSLNGITDLMVILEDTGVTNARFDITLMRGFDYYTDIVFEVFDVNPENNRSMFGGGRYDGLVGMFGVEPVPTVGFGQGDVTMELFLESNGLLPSLKPETDLYMILVGDVANQARDLINDLRREGVNLAVDFSGKKVGACIKVAEKKSIRYVSVVGDEELSSGRLKLKDISSGKEEEMSMERLVGFIKDRRN